MRVISVFVALFASFIFAGCAQVPQQADGPPQRHVKEVVVVDETQEISYKEISGFWIGRHTGWLSDFYLKDVRISGETFTATFHLRSASRLSCSVTEPVKGTYANHTLQWVLRGDIGCIKNWYYKVTLNIASGKGVYVAGTRPSSPDGWFEIKEIIQ